jgi:hypothetical protein
MASKLKIVKSRRLASRADLRRDLGKLRQLEAEIAALARVQSRVRAEFRALRKRIEDMFDVVGVGSKPDYSRDDLKPSGRTPAANR